MFLQEDSKDDKTTKKGIQNTKKECFKFEQTLKKYINNKKYMNKLYIMEEVQDINSVSVKGNDNGNDNIFHYLRSKADLDTLIEQYATFFFINPEGDKIDVLEGASFDAVKRQVLKSTKDNYEL